ncbi:MAG TPA: chemotaxis protein CheB, partial [Pseudoxanthomonas sp.]|nr:chemotaxis protein CheB [Pseudoxanthomonas sp.]
PAKTSGLTLELESLHSAATGPGVRGAVLLFAGIGGPDAVRKVLADLPPDLPRPVLVQLRLDGGRYDNLVKQMERVSALPVMLAKAGEAARAAQVYVLPNDVAVNVEEGVVHFAEGTLQVESLIASLPPAESAVLLLSGSDPAQVEAAMALAAQGGLVAGQSPQGCYDPAASKALAARGGMVASPADLAAQLATHWPD